jgi:hypothetical protein
MKKILIGLGALLIISAFAVLFLIKDSEVSDSQSNSSGPLKTFVDKITPSGDKENVTIYFSMGKDSNSSCAFAALGDCRLYSLSFSAPEVWDSKSDVIFDVDSFSAVIPGVSAVIPDVSPDNSALSFRSGADSGGYSLQSVYTYKFETEEVISITDGVTFNDSGHWPTWSSDNTLVISNSKQCIGSDCSRSSKFENLTQFTFNDDLSEVISNEVIYGEDACSFSDPAFSGELLAFHSSPVDGVTQIHGDDCPFIEGLSGTLQGGSSAPRAIVMNTNSSVKNLKDLVEGRDYWELGLESAGINGCAHVDFLNDGTVICLEQGTVDADEVCSNPNVAVNQCQKTGNSIIKVNKVFGFELKKGEYQNINAGNAALFDHAHPLDLPNVEDYWKASEGCPLYATKYAQQCGKNTLFATVQCMGPDANAPKGYTSGFSRTMLIHYADPDNPIYIDLNGWVQDEFPEQWDSGEISGFAGTCVIN